jgi:1-acyl-sn-glycerol-3-phosphate acyltransferase
MTALIRQLLPRDSAEATIADDTPSAPAREETHPPEPAPFSPPPRFSATEWYRKGARALARFIYNPKYYGFERIPETGPAVLIANHVSYVDGLVIFAGLKRPVHYVIDKSIYELPGVNYFMRLNGSIPIAPKREVVEAALDQISEYLKQGELVCIFPEGRLTYTGSLGRFKPGIEFIIKRDPVPVYPIALNGLWGSVFSRKYLRSRFRWFPRSFRRRDIRAICGEPIQPDDVNVNRLQEIVLKLKYSL